MLIGNTTPPFVARFGRIWHDTTHLKDITSVRALPDECVFVTFDVEGFTHSVHEIGMAVVRVATGKPLRPLRDADLNTFRNDNGIQAYTVNILENPRAQNRGPAKNSKQSFTSIGRVQYHLQQIFCRHRPKGCPLVLVGYDLYNDFDWMAHYCPMLLSYFTYWLDVQELVQADCGARPKLDRVMASLAGRDPQRVRHKSHRAAMDGVNMLAVLSVLMDGQKLTYVEQPYVNITKSRVPSGWEKSAF